MNLSPIKERISRRTLWFVISWTIISLASGWILAIYEKLSLALFKLDISAYYAFSSSFSLEFLFCFFVEPETVKHPISKEFLSMRRQ